MIMVQTRLVSHIHLLEVFQSTDGQMVMRPSAVHFYSVSASRQHQMVQPGFLSSICQLVRCIPDIMTMQLGTLSLQRHLKGPHSNMKLSNLVVCVKMILRG